MTTPSTCRSLYIHVPYCLRKCGYCDFYSQALDPAQAPRLVDALLRELATAHRRQPLEFDTVYIGGGTPTVLPSPLLERLLRGLRGYIATGADVEFTVEANPATVTHDLAAALAAFGVNRVSIGAQSFAPAELAVLERAHAPEQVHETIAACRRAGIQQLNLDLIFGIPGQTKSSWIASIDAAIGLEPDHVSCYGLTYEEGTRLHQRVQTGQVCSLDHDLEADLYELTLEMLPAAGYAQYEISNFARPGARCRHNLRCWHNEPYLGIGPAAAGFIDDVRYKNVSDTAAYIEAVDAGRAAHVEQERLPPDRRARETAMLALRLTAGINRQRFAGRHGADPAVLFADAIKRHVARGLLEVDDVGVRLTRAGLLLADTVMADFL